MAQIIEQASLSMTNSLFGEKTFNARKTKVTDIKLETAEKMYDFTANPSRYKLDPSEGYEGISEAEITVNVE